MSPPPDGVTTQSHWPCGTATRTYSLYNIGRGPAVTLYQYPIVVWTAYPPWWQLVSVAHGRQGHRSHAG